jgi:diguanylate cyclase (GGDEF)-like protein
LDSPLLGQQLLLFLAEAVLVASLLLALFRLRGVFGLVPIYTTVGVLYQMANLLAGTVYVKVTPDLLMSPGSVVLFPAVVFAVLFVYIREDAQEARKLIYALIAADLVVAALGLLVAQHFESPLVFNPYDLSPALFLQQPRLVVVGTLALYADTLLIIFVYEVVSRHLSGLLFLRITLSLLVVLLFDTVVFVTGSFVESPAYGAILLSGLLGKTVAGVVYATLLTVYLRYFDVVGERPLGASRTLGDLFQVLTYRQKYEVLQAQMTRDALTGIHNRGFFEEMLSLLLAHSRRTGNPLTLLMMDLDHFKQLNDTYGHPAGDEALQVVATTIAATSRTSDVVCRYGGEEFAVLLPDTDLEEGLHLAERITRVVTLAAARQHARWSERPLTATIGLACFPGDAHRADALVPLADRRLYAGKAQGRNCVVASGEEADNSAADTPLTA